MTGFFIYMFLDEEEKPLYIGQSINLIKRIEKQHFLSEYGNLSEECILKTKQVLYHECISVDDMKVKERYLINTLSPKFNISLNNKSRFSFSIEINWKYLPLNMEKLIQKKEEKKIKNKQLQNIPVKIVNVGTKTNIIYGAKISNEFRNDYVKFKIGTGLHNTNLMFKINSEIYLACNYFYWHLRNGKPEKGYGKRFDEHGKNKYGLLRSDYLNVEIMHFQDVDFVNPFLFGEIRLAENMGYPIICKNKELNELYCDYDGCYYEFNFTLIRYTSLKNLSLLDENFILKTERYLT